MRWIVLVSAILLSGIVYVAVVIAPPATQPSMTDWFLVGLTVVLGSIAAIQAYIYSRQAALMQETLRATQHSSDAAKRSADAVMASEQGRIVLSVVDASLSYPDNGNRDQRVIRISYKLTNYGRTPAWIRTCQIGVVDPLDPALDGDPAAGSHQFAYGPADRPPIAPGASEDATMPPATVVVREHDNSTQTMDRHDREHRLRRCVR